MSIGQCIARHHPDGPEKTLLESGAFHLVYTKYDWSLNGQARAGASGAAQ